MKRWCVQAAMIAAVIVFAAGGGAGQAAGKGKTGAEEFQVHCLPCHPDGGNLMKPDKPMKGSKKLATFKTFLAWIREPVAPMPVFSPAVISDQQARELYNYISSSVRSNR